MLNKKKAANFEWMAPVESHYEKDLLGNLGIPAVNLESFGCPKAEHLFDALVWLETCGHHTELNTLTS